MQVLYFVCSVLNWRSPSHYIFIHQQNNLFDRAHVIASVHNAHLTRVLTLTRTGLLLRVDQIEPHNIRQFSTEQSIGFPLIARSAFIALPIW